MNKLTRSAVLVAILGCLVIGETEAKIRKCKFQRKCGMGQYCAKPSVCPNPGNTSSSVSSSSPSNGCPKRCLAGVGGTCFPAVACQDANAACNGAGVCECIAGYTDRNGADHFGGTCEADLGSTCSATVPCSDDHATCDNGTCVCGSGYLDSNGVVDGGLCNAGLGFPCDDDTHCDDCNAVCDCDTHMCVCGSGYADTNGKDDGGECGAASCKVIYQDDPKAPTTEYYIYTSTGVAINVFCDFYKKRGYTYIPRSALGNMDDFEQLYESSDESAVNIKVLYTNEEQHFVSMEQLSMYKHMYPISLQLSQNIGYATPQNFLMGPWIYLGILPKEFAHIKSVMNSRKPLQGYRSGGIDTTFNNCDTNPNSYLVLLANYNGFDETNKYTKGSNTTRMYNWIKQTQLLPAYRHMSLDFYYQWEMHMGGCGGYLTTNNLPDIIGIALGFEFEVSNMAGYCKKCNTDCHRAKHEMVMNIPS